MPFEDARQHEVPQRPVGEESRIPIAAITGTNGKTTTSRMLGHIMKASGKIVGMTSTDGVYVDGKLSVKGDMTGPKSAQICASTPGYNLATRPLQPYNLG